MNDDIFDSYKGQFSRITFNEGGTIRALKGTIEASSSDFLTLKTLKQSFVLPTKNIIKVQIGYSDEDGRKYTSSIRGTEGKGLVL